MRAFLEEPSSGRFRISDDSLPVVEEQLIPIGNLTSSSEFHKDHMIVQGLQHDDESEVFKYKVDFSHFRVSQYSNDILTLIVNPVDSLYFENGNSESLVDDSTSCF